eukprot:CAMPEP_0201594796 /NCGR_PEP_ID=MMETSP0190_2-20130828/192001_1 /ASSEMBLY_ACC=CAM_ASM_000263 /TAXON_ID=37353 /ORGANISM="Rosalina sp." /LENGTH=335 /DNA_ID=CAMNT_0048054541 /DNA_START=112 /DNA_END=1119 /DNA_ORIENTATION=-
MLTLLAIIGLFKISSSALCKGLYIVTDEDGGRAPVFPFDVCFDAVSSKIDVSGKYACDGTTPYQYAYLGHGCSGSPIVSQPLNDTDSGFDAECSGSKCSYAIFRQYENTDCEQTGDYVEAPVVTNECIKINATNSGEISCSDTNIRTTIYGDATCGTEVRTETVFETGCDKDDNTYGEVLEFDVSIKYACDGSVPYQKGYAGHGCSGDTIINQAFDLDGAAAECSGTTCSYAVFRTYEATDCSQSGDYIEAPIITNECLQVNSTHSGEISCSETNIRTTIYGDTTCGTELRTEKMFETGCDADDNTYGEVLECAGCKIKIYTVFTAIFAALYSLF